MRNLFKVSSVIIFSLFVSSCISFLHFSAHNENDSRLIGSWKNKNKVSIIFFESGKGIVTHTNMKSYSFHWGNIEHYLKVRDNEGRTDVMYFDFDLSNSILKFFYIDDVMYGPISNLFQAYGGVKNMNSRTFYKQLKAVATKPSSQP
tara:strand:- start:48 stop:488 length:441 start_codon:yes stop_codon:yes gene_type:complete